MVFHWSLSDSKSPQVSRTRLRILAVLSNAVIWIVSTRPPTSKSSRPFNNPLVTVPNAPITIGTIVTFMFRNFFKFSSKVEVLILLFTFLQIYSVVCRDSKVDNFTESTEKDIETRFTKAWTAINRLSTIWKSDLTDKMKRSFFQAAVTSILLYGCTTWTLTKRLEKKLDGNYTRMLRAILNKSWQQHPTRHQLYGHLPPITKSIQVRRTRHAGHCWRSRDELIRDVLLWIPTHGAQKQDDQHERTFSSYVRIQVVVLKTYLGR